MMESFIGRQPIFDRSLNVIGYELLYRKYPSEQADLVDYDQATSQVILNAFTGLGLSNLVGCQRAFINLTPSFILNQLPLPFPPGQVVLEIPETIKITPEVKRAVRRLAERGYEIALDDVSRPADVRPLLDLVDIVKIDLLEMPQSIRQIHLKYLQRWKSFRLLAEKVETQDELDACREMGFDYFQGYFLCRPNIVKGRKLPPSRQAILHLLCILQDPDVEFVELEAIVASDVSLGYKLMKLVNSAFFCLPNRVQSLRQALALLGFEQLKGWLTLFLVADSNQQPVELSVIAAARARMCQLLAEEAHLPHPSTYFLTGLFSVLDALLMAPLDDILMQIPLSEDIMEALTLHRGALGAALACVKAYEQGDWPSVRFPPLSTDTIRDAYLHALRWSEEIRGLVTNPC